MTGEFSWAAIENVPRHTPILIVGPTASGKSALALECADRFGGTIINADALQVFENWRVLSAQPDVADQARAKHVLYGHLPYDADYSVGAWLREVEPFLNAPERSIIVGGTGLYFTALTQGLAEIPATPPNIRAEADAIVADIGFEALIAEIDELTQSSIDLMNPMRVQRAWEVQRVTGKGIRAWQDETPAPLLSLTNSVPILFDVEKDWLNARIAQRFDTMLDTGALEEAQKNLENWDPALLSNRAIGAPELVAHLQGKMTLEDAREAATIATRQFAKRQRTWFRSKMKDWLHYRPLAATK
ncbi:MAG: tRNA (adenosine(37)-N6)-dimethylallyltransferase MiaA [Paracoccaceae bacterium]|jgi:tRNA dimethylallyltransferase